jgi:hypothetical protein
LGQKAPISDLQVRFNGPVWDAAQPHWDGVVFLFLFFIFSFEMLAKVLKTGELPSRPLPPPRTRAMDSPAPGCARTRLHAKRRLRTPRGSLRRCARLRLRTRVNAGCTPDAHTHTQLPQASRASHATHATRVPRTGPAPAEPRANKRRSPANKCRRINDFRQANKRRT